MKKQSQLILLGALAVGGYYAYSKGMFGKKTTEETTPEETTPEEKTTTGGGKSYTTKFSPATKTTALIDQSSGGNIKDTIDKAKQLVSEVKDLTVKIRTPKGQPNVKIAKKKKKPTKAQRQSVDIKTLKRIAQTDCSKIKSASRKARCENKVAKAKQDIQMFMLRLQGFRK